MLPGVRSVAPRPAEAAAAPCRRLKEALGCPCPTCCCWLCAGDAAICGDGQPRERFSLHAHACPVSIIPQPSTTAELNSPSPHLAAWRKWGIIYPPQVICERVLEPRPHRCSRHQSACAGRRQPDLASCGSGAARGGTLQAQRRKRIFSRLGSPRGLRLGCRQAPCKRVSLPAQRGQLCQRCSRGWHAAAATAAAAAQGWCARASARARCCSRHCCSQQQRSRVWCILTAADAAARSPTRRAPQGAAVAAAAAAHRHPQPVRGVCHTWGLACVRFNLLFNIRQTVCCPV